MADWVTISQVATAGGTLVLAIATFASIKSANRAARVAERSLLMSQRPVLIPSREDDPVELARFGDGFIAHLGGHRGTLDEQEGRYYMAISLRNGGAGLAVLHGWRVSAPPPRTFALAQPELGSFRRQTRDLYVPAGQTGFWQGAIRDPDDPDYALMQAAAESGDRVHVDLLYGDQEGGQRAIVRFGISAQLDPDAPPGGARSDALRHWTVDGPNPR